MKNGPSLFFITNIEETASTQGNVNDESSRARLYGGEVGWWVSGPPYNTQ